MQKEHESIFQYGYLSFLQFVLAYFSSVGLVDLFNAPANVPPKERLKKCWFVSLCKHTLNNSATGIA
jgi:hypothetical protein